MGSTESQCAYHYPDHGSLYRIDPAMDGVLSYDVIIQDDHTPHLVSKWPPAKQGAYRTPRSPNELSYKEEETVLQQCIARIPRVATDPLPPPPPPPRNVNEVHLVYWFLPGGVL